MSREHWRNAVIGGFAVCAGTAVVLGAYEIERRGLAFFAFRNAGAGAGNPAGLAESKGPQLGPGARERMNMHAIQIAAFIVAVGFAYWSGKWSMGWRFPRWSERPMRAKAPAEPRAPRRIRPLHRQEVPAWEGDDFYRTADIPVVTDAQPSRRWWRKSYADEVMDEAATFVSELHDSSGDADTFAGPGTTTINSIEDVLAWGQRMHHELESARTRELEEQAHWTQELGAWQEPQLALAGQHDG